MSRRRWIVVVSLVALLSTAALGIGRFRPSLVTAAMTPSAAFDATAVPRAPDYTADAAWLALPSTADDADVTLPELPAVDPAAAEVDVFYVHPTTSIERRWNAPADEPAVRAASARGGTLIQASVFSGCCAVYAPTYRQASGMAFVTPSPAGDQAIDLAFADVSAAFAEFQRRRGSTRPFVLAGHSQGAVLAARLLRERIANGEARHRLVAAYLIGAPITSAAIAPLQACTAPDQTGCVVAFNARGPGHERDAFESGTSETEKAWLCVNPTTGTTTADRVDRGRHGGALFFDAERPAILPAFAASHCAEGRLVVSGMQTLPARDVLSGVLLWVMGGENFHAIEYQLFYLDLRADAKRRTLAWGPAQGIGANADASADGTTPSIRRNVRVRCAASENPAPTAASVRLAPAASACPAASSRSHST